ncbi:MAG: hypothetical protein RBR81_11975 [Bacteroidales bacterium]|jgi:hypothetical protein|nr:hypothetical protein [Bacteroidales bacterium]
MERKGRTLKILFLTATLSLILLSARAATYTSVRSGNWNAPSTWGSASYPVTGDEVFISEGHNINVTTDAACATVTFTGRSGSLTVNSPFTLTLSGNLTLRKQSNANVACSISGSGILVCSNVAVGSDDNSPSNNNTTRTHVLTSSIAALTISGNLSINSYRRNNNRVRNGSFYLDDGIVSVGGSVITTNQHNSNISTLTMANGTASGTLNLTGAVPFNLSGTGTNTIILNGAAALVNYSYAGSQDVAAFPYNNLTISGGNTKTIQGNISVSGTLNLDNGNLSLGSGTNNITLGESSLISATGGFSNTRMIICDGDGNLIKQGTSVNDFIIVYPVGTGTFYTPFEITGLTATVGGTGSIAVKAIASVAPGPPAAAGSDLNKYWSITTTNLSNINADISLTYINPDEVGSGGNQTKYVPFLYSGSAWTQPGSYSPAGTNPMTVAGTSVIDGQWTAREIPDYTAYYSYQSGSWNDASTWTSDPSGTLQVGTTIPGNGDNVIILTGRTVSLPTDVTASGLNLTIEAGGFIDQALYRFTNTLSSLCGDGTLKLASVSFPVVSNNTFVDAGGGTTEYYNTADFLLPLAQTTYNNLVINTAGATATQLGNINLNGNLTIKEGTFRINDDISSTKLALTVNGDITVDNGASFRIGKGVTNTSIGGSGGTAPFLNYYLNFHTVIVNGDFTNNGTVRFTNLDFPVYNAFPPTIPGATSGAATVYFQGAGNNALNCNGITDFYNLVIDKGIDQTYKLTVTSTSYLNFKIYGANFLSADGTITGNPDLRKSLWIRNGTLVLKGQVFIPSLSEGTSLSSDYYIPSNGALVTDGVDVIVFSTADDYREINIAYGTSAPSDAATGITKGGNSSLTIFGKLEVNNGILSCRESAGLITSSIASGQVSINGGTVDAKQFLSSSGNASYTQTGGVFILRGRLQRTPVEYSSIANLTDFSVATLNTVRVLNGVNSSYGTFNLENSGNIYTVSGGSVLIYDVVGTSANEAFDVKSSDANINVTGGTLELFPVAGAGGDDATSFMINSTAPVFNLTVNRISSTSVAELSTSLIIKNDLYLASGELAAGGNDLSIGGDLTMEAGTSYFTGANTTTLNGSDDQQINLNIASALSLNNFILDKNAGKSVIMSGSQNTINVVGNFSLITGILADGGKTINVSGNLFNSGLHQGTGSIILNSSASEQTIDGNGNFKNLTLANSFASSTAPVSLVANATINGVLLFEVSGKHFNIGTHNLLLNSEASIVTGSPSNYILTAGNAGDGGITKTYQSTGSFTFPVGVPSKYTPATIGITEAPESFGSITVVPVNYEHPVSTINNQSLQYYWRIKSAGFTGILPNSVTHSFTYAQVDVVGSESSYVPALYDATTHIWHQGLPANINTDSNAITDWITPSNSTGFLDADYTAGVSSSFGSPRIYYSRQSGTWSTLSTWSLTSHTVNNPPPAAPGINDIVIIGNGHMVTFGTPPNYLSTANTDQHYCASLQIEEGATLDIRYNPGSNFGMVVSHPGGNGNFRLTTSNASGSTFAFPGGDFSDFNTNRGTTEFYTTNANSGAIFYLPSTPASYGTVIMSPLGGSNIAFPNIPEMTILGDLITRGQDWRSWLAMTWMSGYGTIVEKTINVKGNLNLEGGTFIYVSNGSTSQNIIIDGDVNVFPGAGIDIYGTSYANNMSIGGSLINNSNDDRTYSLSGNAGSNVRFYVSSTRRCDVTFFGSDTAYITNTGLTPATGSTPNTIFGNLTIDKGISIESVLICNIGGSLTTRNDNWLTLLNGTFKYDRTGSFYISQETDFFIPATAGLTINTPSNVYISNNNASETLSLNGKLTILDGGGNVYIGPVGNTVNNADIEYSGSGASTIEVQGGNLYVNGQIRRPLASTNGVLNYSQSGGNVIIYGNNPTASNLIKAKLEVLNNGSAFSMSGGILTIARGGGTTFGDLYLRPSVSSVTGGTIVFSQAPVSGTTIDSDQSFKLDANIALNSLEVSGKTAGTARNAILNLMISPLVLHGSLTLANNFSTFNSNNLNVTVKGNMINNGTYNYGTNVTSFTGGSQSVSGTSITDFYDLDVQSLTSLSVNHSFIVNRNLNIRNGNLVLDNNRVTLIGNLLNNSSYTDNNSTGGIVLAGTQQQQVSGMGSFGLLELNNQAGARLYSEINLQNNLVLTSGILDINIHELILNQNSIIMGAPFSVSKMIKSDGVISSLGVKKFFNPGPAIFTFPVGVSGKYTPATYTISANGAAGYIKVNPINGMHPSVLDDSNVLRYYWQIESSGISGFSGTALLKYLQDDVFGIEDEYVAARLEMPANIWHEALSGSITDNVDENSDEITFVFAGSNNLNGDYTAGNNTAIPGEVPSYQTNSSGNWSDETIWTPLGLSPACPPGGPNGAIVIINHTVTADINGIYVFSTTVNDRLRLVSPTFGHSLGYVYGDGTIYLENGNLPGGNYAGFSDCSGDGTIEYGGTGTYTIIATLFDNLPNVQFTGTGSRILPNKDLTICKRLVIDGPTLDNSVNNSKLVIMGSMERYNSGVFTSGTGSYPVSTVTFAGTSAQALGGITGNFTGTSRFNNLEINNPSGLIIGDGGSAEVSNQLLLTEGSISTSSSNSLTLLNTSSSAVLPIGGHVNSFINGPLIKYILNGDSFNYPLGKGSMKGHDFILTSTAGITLPFTAEFFTPNPTATLIASPLEVSNTSEYWSIASSTPTTAKVKIGWDPQSDLTPLMATNGLTDMRVAEFTTGYWSELASNASGDEYTGSVETANSVAILPTARNFTTACVSGTLARASFASVGPVCGNIGIPVSFTSFHPINLNYTLCYTLDGIPQAPVTVTSLPFILPASSAGAYRLTDFTYDNGTGTGVVDRKTVIVYSNPETSDAGPDQSLCGVSTVQLQGNDPAPFNGLWTIVSGEGGSLESSSQYNTEFNGSLGVTYSLRWTISNGPCTSSDDVVISFPVAASTPGEFTSAPVQVCQGSTGYTYTVPLVAGVIYSWSYSGTGCNITGTGNSVSVDFDSAATSGTLSVTATNDCGTSSARTVDIEVISAQFEYSGYPYCQNDPDPYPDMGTGSLAGTFSSSPGLVFISSLTGQIDLAASTPGNYTVTNTVEVAACGILTATSPVIISGLTWTGANSADWNDPDNWSCGFVPYSTSHAVIPDMEFDPVLENGITGTVNNLTIENGASLLFTGGSLQISGTIANDGIIDVNDGTIEMKSASAQTIGASVFSGNTIKNIIINNTEGVTLLGPLNVSGIVTVQNGNLVSNGNLTLLSTELQTALINGSGNGDITGDVTVQRYLPSAYGYKYVSSPFQAATVSEFDDDMDLDYGFPTFYSYDENRTVSGDPASGWTDYSTKTNILYPMAGYAANLGPNDIPNTIDVTGIVNNGNVSITLYNNNNPFTQGFNLVGNPYPSPIDWDAISGWTKSNIDDAIYFFSATDEYDGIYCTYINGIPSDDNMASNIIPSMQGFFVHVSNGSFPVTAFLGADNSVRITDLTYPFIKSEKKNSVPLLRLEAAYNDDISSADPLVIYFEDKASNGFDSKLDALKLMNTDYYTTNFFSLSSAGDKLSINSQPFLSEEFLQIPLGLKITMDGNIVFSLKDAREDFTKMKIFLYDSVSRIEQELGGDKIYKVYLQSGEYLQRFFLNMRAEATDVDEINMDNNIFSIYSSHGILNVDIFLIQEGKGILTMYNTTGQVIMLEKVNGNGHYEFNTDVTDGIYIITYTSGKYRNSKKIFIKNR